MSELRKLIRAWADGKDCWFAIRDMLLDLGFHKVAYRHADCDQSIGHRKACNLFAVVAFQHDDGNMLRRLGELEDMLF